MFPAFIYPDANTSNSGWVLGIWPDGYEVIIPPAPGSNVLALKPSNFFTLGLALGIAADTIRKDGT